VLNRLASLWAVQPFSAKLMIGNALLTNVPPNAADLGSADDPTIDAFHDTVFQRFAQSSYTMNDAVRLASAWNLNGDTLGAKCLIGERLLAGQAIG
jgi:hypothetical protein